MCLLLTLLPVLPVSAFCTSSTRLLVEVKKTTKLISQLFELSVIHQIITKIAKNTSLNKTFKIINENFFKKINKPKGTYPKTKPILSEEKFYFILDVFHLYRKKLTTYKCTHICSYITDFFQKTKWMKPNQWNFESYSWKAETQIFSTSFWFLYFKSLWAIICQNKVDKQVLVWIFRQQTCQT